VIIKNAKIRIVSESWRIFFEVRISCIFLGEQINFNKHCNIMNNEIEDIEYSDIGIFEKFLKLDFD